MFSQQSIAKAIEEKITGDQRRYLLNEQLKAIKKVVQLLLLLLLLIRVQLAARIKIMNYILFTFRMVPCFVNSLVDYSAFMFDVHLA